jgi:anthranilate phosphoribosyltransferase
MEPFRIYLEKAASGKPLTQDEAAQAFDLMIQGDVSAVHMSGFLMALRARGETVDELTGAVAAMRGRMLRIEAPGDVVDIVGTGGDGRGTYNISTCAAFIAAGAGARVAKHGNRSASSKSGAADVLEALGVNIAMAPETAARAIREAGVTFLFAPLYHAAMKHVAPVRKALGVRSIFNLLGPLSNPAGASRQVVGVFAREWLAPFAEALDRLGSSHVWAVHSFDGFDELTTTGRAWVVELKDGEIREFEIGPADAGIAAGRIEDLLGGDARENADAIRRVLAGERNAFRDVAVMNAGAALVVTGKARCLEEGAELAAKAIDSGQAAAALDHLATISNS